MWSRYPRLRLGQDPRVGLCQRALLMCAEHPRACSAHMGGGCQVGRERDQSNGSYRDQTKLKGVTRTVGHAVANQTPYS